MDRREELMNVLKNVDDSTKPIVLPLIDDIIFLEDRLTSLRKLPFIRIHPTDSEQQKTTPAAKQYKELLQQYNNCVKILLSAIGKEEGNEESPLRLYFKRFRQE